MDALREFSESSVLSRSIQSENNYILRHNTVRYITTLTMNTMMRSRFVATATSRSIYRRRALYLTAAAALGSSLSNTAGCCHAFSGPAYVPRAMLYQQQQQHNQQTRLYSSNNEDNGGFFGGLAKAAKSILPKSWTQTEKERQIELKTKQAAKEIKGGIDMMLKDAPLPIRMMGKMVAPILSSVMSTVASEIGEQQRQVQDFMDEAQACMVADPDVRQALGEPIQVEPPFSQMSSSMSINGKSTSSVDASFYVIGSRARGTAQMTATEGRIARLVVNINGRQMQVSLTPNKWSNYTVDVDMASSSSLGKNRINQNDIIDVEFVEKKDIK